MFAKIITAEIPGNQQLALENILFYTRREEVPIVLFRAVRKKSVLATTKALEPNVKQ